MRVISSEISRYISINIKDTLMFYLCAIVNDRVLFALDDRIEILNRTQMFFSGKGGFDHRVSILNSYM